MCERLQDRPEGVNLIAIAGERLGHEAFLKNYWTGDGLFIDEGKQSVFPVLQTATQGVMGGVFSYVMGRGVKKAVKTMDKETPGVKDSGEGEGLKLGGMWVVRGGAEPEIVFEHKENHWGDHADFDEVAAHVEAFGADSKM